MSKVKGLDGRLYNLKLIEADFDDTNRSAPHLRCRDLLKKIYPYDNIFEEVILPGTPDLTVDFIIPLRKLIVEIQGKQHYQYVQHFHKTLQSFQKSKERDALKENWALLNHYRMLKLDDGQQSEWQKQTLAFLIGD